MKFVSKILISALIVVIAFIWIEKNVLMKRPTSVQEPVFQSEITIPDGMQEELLEVLEQFSSEQKFDLSVSTVTPNGEYSITLDRNDIKLWITTAKNVTVFTVYFFDGNDISASSQTIASISQHLGEAIRSRHGFSYSVI